MRFASTIFLGLLLALGVAAQGTDSCIYCCNNCKEFGEGTVERTDCHALCDSYQCGGYPGNCEKLEAAGELN
ncbi:hypothetical protein NpNSSI1_00002383 [Neofusicoccum parvum]|uniref:Uncharacterized protein n=1 Tax=Neofusicoccum parvum TaxID=310453 RepID=A0ACB5RNW2_9PEZI|nr:hypothetical protein NpPPO83_00010069 [Neofusicoccum parvum]GME49187.1 hypothetical protein NpNSSI1_00002383 [Neofusicoccum parvum]